MPLYSRLLVHIQATIDRTRNNPNNHFAIVDFSSGGRVWTLKASRRSYSNNSHEARVELMTDTGFVHENPVKQLINLGLTNGDALDIVYRVAKLVEFDQKRFSAPLV